MTRWFRPLFLVGAILVLMSFSPPSLNAASDRAPRMAESRTADGRIYFYGGGGRYYRGQPRYYYRQNRPRWNRYYYYNYPYRYRHYDRYYYDRYYGDDGYYRYYGPRGGVSFSFGI